MTRTESPPENFFVNDLPRTTASDLRVEGWPETVAKVKATGRLLVTNHNRPEAVILAVAEFEALARLARQAENRTEAVLEELRREYDERLSGLRGSVGAKRLRKNFRRPMKLEGKVRAGKTY